MSMLEDIKTAEQKADALKKDASVAARQTVREAQTTAQQEAAALIEAARKKAAETIAEAEAAAKNDAAALVEENRKRMRNEPRRPEKIWIRPWSIS